MRFEKYGNKQKTSKITKTNPKTKETTIKEVKKPPAGRLLEHNCRNVIDDRVRGNKNIDPARTPLNYDLAEELRNGMSANEYYHIRFAKAEEDYYTKIKKAMKNDAVSMCEWVVTMPKNLPKDKQDMFFVKSYEFLRDTYGEENVIAANVHLDETTPHLHFDFMPFVPDEKNGGKKLCAQNMETPSTLGSMHKKLQVYLERELGCSVELLTGETDGGNKSKKELEIETLDKEIEQKQRKNAKLEEIASSNAKILFGQRDENKRLKTVRSDLQKQNEELQMENEELEISMKHKKVELDEREKAVSEREEAVNKAEKLNEAWSRQRIEEQERLIKLAATISNAKERDELVKQGKEVLIGSFLSRIDPQNNIPQQPYTAKQSVAESSYGYGE